MFENWRNQIIMRLQMEGELSLAAAARVDLFDPNDEGSPLIECVVEGELGAESLVRISAEVTGRPRLDWSSVPYAGIRSEFEAHRDHCLRYRAVPLRVEAGRGVDVAMVDPSWEAAYHFMDALYGLPLRIFVIAYTDFIFITRPDLAPSTPPVVDGAEGSMGNPHPEVEELERFLRAKVAAAGSGPFAPVHTQELPHGVVAGAASEERRLRLLSVEADVEPRLAVDDLDNSGTGQHAVVPPKAVARPYDVGASVGFPLPDTNPVPFRLLHPPMGSERGAVGSTAHDVTARETGVHRAVSERRVRSIAEMIDALLEDVGQRAVWDDIFDISMLLARGCLRGEVLGERMVVYQARLDASILGSQSQELLGAMIARCAPRGSARTGRSARFSLVPITRAERALMAYLADSSLLVGEIMPSGAYSVFGLIGLVHEHLELIKRVLSLVADRSTLLVEQASAAE